MGHPAKEGLRQEAKATRPQKIIAQSGSSSKRGIKTLHSFLSDGVFVKSQSGSSSKRGIKTDLVVFLRFVRTDPRVGHPAKEGLRH